VFGIKWEGSWGSETQKKFCVGERIQLSWGGGKRIYLSRGRLGGGARDRGGKLSQTTIVGGGGLGNTKKSLEGGGKSELPDEKEGAFGSGED